MGKKQKQQQGDGGLQQPAADDQPQPSTSSPEELSRWFSHLVDMIPARFMDPDEERVQLKYLKKAERAVLKEQHKATRKEYKKAKFDPEAPSTSAQQPQQKGKGAGAAHAAAAPASAQPPALNLTVGASSRSELQEKLRAKLEAIRSQRGDGGTKADQAAKKAAAQKAKEWKQKTLAANAQQKQQEAGSKRKHPESANGQQQQQQAGGKQHQQQHQHPKQQHKGGAAAAAGGADTEFKFGRIELEPSRPGHKDGKKAPSKEELLRRAEARQREAQELGGSEQGKAKLQQEAWKSALARASGDKVLDDPKLLRKSLKKEGKRKEKSTQAWQQRKEAVAEQQQQRQQKRAANISQKTQGRVEKKKAKREKKLLRAGFEGRKEGPIKAGAGKAK